jgi:hypothetical protein
VRGDDDDDDDGEAIGAAEVQEGDVGDGGLESELLLSLGSDCCSGPS